MKFFLFLHCKYSLTLNHNNIVVLHTAKAKQVATINYTFLSQYRWLPTSRRCLCDCCKKRYLWVTQDCSALILSGKDRCNAAHSGGTPAQGPCEWVCS